MEWPNIADLSIDPPDPSPQSHCVSSRAVTPADETHPPFPGPVDVVIVGGGACGLAVAIQLIERVRNGKDFSTIVMIEKAQAAGVGLAYSEQCQGSIVNMHTDTMGLCPINPMQFSDWVQSLNPNLRKVPFPTRYQYGLYLKELLKRATTDSKELGVDFKVVHNEATDLYPSSGVFKLVMADGRKIQAYEVVLALGNFCAHVNVDLRGNPSYFRCPWPVAKLNKIQPHESVFIMGSRLTAIDAVNTLIESGHIGPITFISRSGRLPKVQGPAAPYPHRYSLYSLAKEVEDQPEGVLVRVMSEVQDELEDYMPEDFSELLEHDPPAVIMKRDIERAEKGVIAWQTVINATKPLIERYWHCFTEEEKKYFLMEYNSIWVTYRHAIPLENARKILKLLESGQLQVLNGSKVDWNAREQNFHIESKGTKYEAKYLIESLGQEFDTSKIESSLLRNIIASGLVVPHESGGLKVDFETLKATEGIHIIGSMTRGVHFYTTAIDRNAAHASRIADSICGIPYRRPLHIGFFVGNDIFSQLMLAKIVPKLLALGHLPFIFLPDDKTNAIKRPFALRELAFWERVVLQEHVIPFLGTSPSDRDALKTFQQMEAEYGILVESIADINGPHLHSRVEDNYLDLGISLRCYQKFGRSIIEAFSHNNGELLNLHPGILPQYRGVITMIRSMMNGDKDFGYSLHHIDQRFDSGEVIDIRKKPIDYNKTVLANMEDKWEMGVDMVLNAIETFARGGDLHEDEIPQDEKASNYYSFPREKELQICEEKGIKFVDRQEMTEFFVSCFRDEGNKMALKKVIEDSADAWYAENA